MSKFVAEKIIEKPKEDGGDIRVYKLRLNLGKYVESYFGSLDEPNSSDKQSRNLSIMQFSLNETIIKNEGNSSSDTMETTVISEESQQPIDWNSAKSASDHENCDAKSIDYIQMIDTNILLANYNKALEWAGQYYIKSYEEKDLIKRNNAIKYIDMIRNKLGKNQLSESELDFMYLDIVPINVVQGSEATVDPDPDKRANQFVMPSSKIESKQSSCDILPTKSALSRLSEINLELENTDANDSTSIKKFLSRIRQTGDLYKEQSFLYEIGNEFLQDANYFQINKPKSSNDHDEIQALIQAIGYYTQSLKLQSYLNIEHRKSDLTNVIEELFNRLLALNGDETKSIDILRAAIQSGDERLELQAQFDYGNYNYFMREYKKAKENFQRALILVVKFEDSYIEADIYYKLAQISERMGEYRSALNYLDCNLMIIEKIGYESQLGKTYLTLADLLKKINANETAQYFNDLYDQLWNTDITITKSDCNANEAHQLLTRLIYDENYFPDREFINPNLNRNSVIELRGSATHATQSSRSSDNLPSTSYSSSSSAGIHNELDSVRESHSTDQEEAANQIGNSISMEGRSVLRMMLHPTPGKLRDEAKYLPLKKRKN